MNLILDPPFRSWLTNIGNETCMYDIQYVMLMEVVGNLNAGLKEDGPKEAQAVGKMNEMNSEKWS